MPQGAAWSGGLPRAPQGPCLPALSRETSQETVRFLGTCVSPRRLERVRLWDLNALLQVSGSCVTFSVLGINSFSTKPVSLLKFLTGGDGSRTHTLWDGPFIPACVNGTVCIRLSPFVVVYLHPFIVAHADLKGPVVCGSSACSASLSHPESSPRCS